MTDNDNTGESKDSKPSRRDFLIGAAVVATTMATGCEGKQRVNEALPVEISEEQRARRRNGRSQVALIECKSYEEEIFEKIKNTKNLKLPEVKGKSVVIKPNMVEYRQGTPVTTNPAVLSAAIKLMQDLGAAKITVAEGPGHMRDTEYLLDATGLGKACKDNGVPFVDLNIDDLEEMDNSLGFNGITNFFLPKTIVHADVVVSLPKMKTHHWVGMTCSMKNLFGTVPGRKYGWPKNLLHVRGIPHSILDLQHLVKPKLAIVDAIVTMEGDGPINGTAKPLGYVIIGEDLAAVDATCARIMKLNPHDLPYINMAGKVVGNIEEDMIDILGPKIAEIAMTYELPITLKDKELLKQADRQGS